MRHLRWRDKKPSVASQRSLKRLVCQCRQMARCRGHSEAMSKGYPEAVERLIDSLQRMPGIGRRSATRLAFHLLKADAEETEELARAITDIKREVRVCPICWHLAEEQPCRICADPSRSAACRRCAAWGSCPPTRQFRGASDARARNDAGHVPQPRLRLARERERAQARALARGERT